MPIAEKMSLAVPILISLVIHGLVLTAGEVVSRMGRGTSDAPLTAEYRLPATGAEAPGSPEKRDGDESRGTTISLEAPAPAYRPYFKKLRNRIGGEWKEPDLRAGDPTQGNLLVEFTIESAGELKDVSVARSSGVMSFDFAAVEAVKKAAPFPSFPPEIQERELKIRALFVYE